MLYAMMSDEETKTGSASCTKLMRNPDSSYQNLASAIVCMAADDYRAALASRDKYQQAALEDFFHSHWYGVLTTIAPEVIMEGLQREYYAKRREARSSKKSR
jgi:hypothetical protein